MRPFVVFMMLPLLAWGDCPNAIRLKVGDRVSDCDRIGYSEAYDQRVVKELKDYKLLQEIDLQKDSLIKNQDLRIKTQSEMIQTWAEDSQYFRTAYKEERDAGNLKLYLGVFMGVLLSGFAVWGASQLR